MPTENDWNTLDLDGWTFLHKPSETLPANTRTLIQIHGLSGDETVMSIFTRNFPGGYEIFSPRAPYGSVEGGYTWLENQSGTDAPLEAYRPAVEGLLSRIDTWMAAAGLEKQMLDLLGFSQGAALAGALTLIYPRRVRSLGLLSGFLPTAINANPADNSLNGLRVFIAHGTLDDRVPIRHARQAAATLQKAGAQVEFCEANVGHKLGLPCFKALESFFMRSN